RGARVEDDADGLAGGQRTVLEERRDVTPFEKLHHDVRRAIVERADVEHARDVLALEPSDRARLAHEPLLRLGVHHRRREHELQRDELIELDIARRDDDAHPALPEDALDLEFPREDISFTDAHRRASRMPW